MIKLFALWQWTTGLGVVAPAITVAQWCWPVTTRSPRVFVPRSRLPRIEFGHVEGTIATDD